MAPWHGTGHPGVAEALGGCPPRAGGCHHTGSETSPQQPARWRRGCLRRMLPLIISELIGYSIIFLAISSRVWEQPVSAAEAALGTGENKLARQSHLPVAFAAWLRRGARLPGGGEGTSPQPPQLAPTSAGCCGWERAELLGGQLPLWQAQISPHEVLGEVRGRAQGAKTLPGKAAGREGAASAPQEPAVAAAGLWQLLLVPVPPAQPQEGNWALLGGVGRWHAGCPSTSGAFPCAAPKAVSPVPGNQAWPPPLPTSAPPGPPAPSPAVVGFPAPPLCARAPCVHTTRDVQAVFI